MISCGPLKIPTVLPNKKVLLAQFKLKKLVNVGKGFVLGDKRYHTHIERHSAIIRLIYTT